MEITNEDKIVLLEALGVDLNGNKDIYLCDGVETKGTELMIGCFKPLEMVWLIKALDIIEKKHGEATFLFRQSQGYQLFIGLSKDKEWYNTREEAIFRVVVEYFKQQKSKNNG